MIEIKLMKLLENLKKVIIGKDEVLENVIICLISKGHLLIEDAPGVGKTTLVKGLADSIDLSFKRLQFTPDLMPSDILGINIYNKDTNTFNFKKGPLFNNIFLADEINRTSPKTQSSLLQAMEEGEISTEDEDYILDKPFMVLATQNPLEYKGTFPLPEAQLDRFLMKISIGYPDFQNEISILKNDLLINNKIKLEPVISREEILEIQDLVSNLTVHDDIYKYIVSIIHQTRKCSDLLLGASPRASIDLLIASKAKAYVSGRNYVIPDDVKSMVLPILSHRLILSHQAKIEKKEMTTILLALLKEVFLPVIGND